MGSHVPERRRARNQDVPDKAAPGLQMILGACLFLAANVLLVGVGNVSQSDEAGVAEAAEMSVADHLREARAYLANRDFLSARTMFEEVLKHGGAPVPARSIAQLGMAETYLVNKQYDAAKSEYAKVFRIDGAPRPHVQEAEQRINEIGRVVAGLPPRDPSASKTPLPEWPEPSVVLYVAPDGDDAGPGSSVQPFGTLEGARDALRRIRSEGGVAQGGAAVIVRGGHYRVVQTFTLEEEDSGTPSGPIRYCAAEGETPVFRGGIRLEGFAPVTEPSVAVRLPEEARDRVVQLDLARYGLTDLKPLRLGAFASGGGFRTYPVMELFFDGEAMPMSRWPNEGFARVADVAVKDGHTIHYRKGSKAGRLIYDGDRPERWKQEANVWLYGYWFFDWADSYERVVSIDTQRRELVLDEPYSRYGYRADAPFYALNLLCEIDMPGEWHLDSRTGILYFIRRLTLRRRSLSCLS